MNRRRFLKLLVAVPLALGLRLPSAETEPIYLWSSGLGRPGPKPEDMEAYVRLNWGLDAIEACDGPVWICENGIWRAHDSDGAVWESDDQGYSWQLMGTEEPGIYWSV